MKRTTLVPKLAAMFALLVAPAHAQTASAAGGTDGKQEETIVLDPFEVVTDSEGYSDKNTVIATGFNRELKKTPLMINVVTNEFIRDAGLTDYAAISDFLPNTYVVPQSYGLGSSANARGHGTSYYSQDGTRYYTEPIVGTSERLEVIKGPATLFFGRAQPGGIFNFSTPPPSPTRRQTLTLSYGSFDTARGELSAQGKIDKRGRLTYRFDGIWQEAGSWMDGGFDDIKRVRGALGYTPFKWLTARFNYEYSYRKQSGEAFTPLVFNPQYYADYANPRPEQLAWARTGNRANQTDQQLTTFLQGRWRENHGNWANDTRLAYNQVLSPARIVGVDGDRFGWNYNAAGANSYAQKDVYNWGPSITIVPNRHIALKLSYIKYDLRRLAVFWGGNFLTEVWGDRVIRQNMSTQHATNDSYTVSASLLANYEVWKTRHTTNVGVQRFKDFFLGGGGALYPLNAAPGVEKDPRRSSGSNVTAGFDPRTDPYPNLEAFVLTDPKDGTRNLANTNQNFEDALFASHIVESPDGKFGLLVGGRIQGYENKRPSRLEKVRVGFSDVYTLGASWEVAPDVVLFASTSASFDPNINRFQVEGNGQTAEERLNLTAPSKQGKGYDIGVKFGLFERKLTGSISWFETDRVNDFRTRDDDRINSDPRNLDEDPDNGVSWWLYGGRRLSRGVDLEMTWQLNRNYSALFTWGWLPMAKITENPGIGTVTLPDGSVVLNPNAANLPGTRSGGSPRHKFAFWNRYVFTETAFKGLGVGVGVTYTDEVDPGNSIWDTRVLPEYYLVRFSADYPVKVLDRTMKVGLTLSNLLDKKFYRGRTRGEPFSWTLRTTYSF